MGRLPVREGFGKVRVMRRLVWVLAGAATLAACNGAVEDGEQAAPAPTPTATPSAALVGPSPEPTETSSGARAVSEETDDFLFEYAYPVEAGSIRGLATLLDRRLEARRADLARSSAEARREARSDGFPYNKHSYSAEWEIVADIPRFLSLSKSFTTYGGGAHGNVGMESLVWDKQADKALAGIELFASPAALERALGERYCDALNELREERRGEPDEEAAAEEEPASDVDEEAEPEDVPFTDCPGIEELTVLVGSRSGRRFDRLTLYAGPYVAGPYAEGAYEVNLPVDAAVREAVRPEYRGSFAPRN